MRMIFALLLLVSAAPAFAAGWDRYENARGYGVDVPPEFEAGAEAPNGDGLVFRHGGQVLTVWGGNVTEASFEATVAAAMDLATSAGWNLTYQATTPSWASYSAKQGRRILYARMIALCDGTRYAAFQLEHGSADIIKLEPVVDRLVRSLRASGDGC